MATTALTPRDRAARQRPIAGRRAELDLTEQSLARPGALFVHGEAGIGKTKLVAEALVQVRASGRTVAQSACYPVAEAGPYFPILRLMQQLGLGDDSLPAERDGTSPEISEDAAARRARFVRRLASRLLAGAADAQAVLVVEDLHWADVGSLLVLNDLLDVAGPTLSLVCTARLAEPMEPAARQLVNRLRQRSQPLELMGLAMAELSDLLSDILDTSQLTADELTAMQAYTNGNPLFARELARHLADTGLLERFRLGEALERVRVPADLAAALDLRLASLPAATVGALEAVAVLGGSASSAGVSEVLQEAFGDVQQELELAAEQRLIDLTGPFGNPTAHLTHALYERRLYERLAPKTRRALHRRAAQAIRAGRLPASREDLARHYARGPGRAGGARSVRACREAAEHAEDVLAYESAARFWEMALACLSDKDRRGRADLLRLRGRALRAAGTWSEAIDAWSEAVDLYEEIGEPALAASLCAALGDMCRWRSDLDGAQFWMERGLAFGLGREPETARALAILGGVYRFRQDRRADATLDRARRLVAREEDPRTLYWLSYADLVAGRQTAAEDLARQGLNAARRGGNASATSLLASTVFHAELSALRADAAAEHAASAAGAAVESDAASMISSLICSALLFGYRGEWRRVLEVCESWMAQVRLASRFQVATATVVWAEASFAGGDLPAAEVAVRSALPDLAEMRPVAAVHAARMLAHAGRLDECRSLVSEYAEQLTRGSRTTVVAGRAVLGEVAALLADDDLCQRCYELLRSERRPLALCYVPVSLRRVLGVLASRLKLWPEAVGHFEEAILELTEGGASWELGSALLDYASMRRARGRRGDARKAASLELRADGVYDAMGCSRPFGRLGATDSRPANAFDLTARELEVLQLVAGGFRNQEIALRLTISPGTVNRHLENILGKMQVRSRTEAVVLGAQHGLVGTTP